jgi:hypothetical protein
MKLISLIIPFTIALSTGCATKLDPCGDGMARADDGNCYPYQDLGDTGNKLPDADADAGADDGPPPDNGGADADDGPPSDDGGADADGGPPPDDGGADADGGPPPDDGGADADGGPPPDDGGSDADGGPPPDDGGSDADGGPPPDDGPPPDSGPTDCASDDECTGECFGEGTGCICLEDIGCVPSCDTDSDCPSGMTCSGEVCEP